MRTIEELYAKVERIRQVATEDCLAGCNAATDLKNRESGYEAWSEYASACQRLGITPRP